jgi:hypothetical protein
LQKIETDNIAWGDKRFKYKANKSISEKNTPNSLPLFWLEKGMLIPVLIKENISAEIQELNALVYPENITYEDVLWEIVSSEELNIFDIARTIGLLDAYVPSYNTEEWAQRLKIGLDLWAKIRDLKEIEDQWVSFFVHKNTPLKRVLHFTDNELRKMILPLLELNPGINILENIANLVVEVAHKEQVSISEIWTNLNISVILEDGLLQSTQKLQQIRRKLFEKRYPTIARYRKRLNEHLGGIPRSAGIDLRSDENFETPGMTLQADLRSRADIKKLQDWLETQKPELEKIMDIQKGNSDSEQEE